MSLLARFYTVSEADKTRAVQQLIKDSTPDFDFFFLVILGILMATFGLLADSPTVVIGSMLIAPILFPVLSLSLGLVMADYTVIGRSFSTLVKSFVLGVGAAMVATLLFDPADSTVTHEILLRTAPSLLYVAVAVVAGLAVSFTLVRPELSATLPGVAISVALIPPLAVVGIGLAKLSLSIVSGSFLLFVINVAGIIFASMLSFSLMNFYVKRHVAEGAVKAEEKRIERENQKIEKIAAAQTEAAEDTQA